MKFIQAGYHWVHETFRNKDQVLPKRYLIQLIHSEFLLGIDGEIPKKFPKNTLIVFPADSRYAEYNYGNTDFINDWLEFYADTDEIESLYDLKPGIILKSLYENQIEQLSSIIFEMSAEAREQQDGYTRIIQNLLDTMLLKIKRLVYEEAHSNIDYHHSHHIRFLQIRNLVMSELHNRPDTDEIAKSLCLSVSHFRKCYKEIFGISFTHDLIEARIKMSKQLLEDTDSSCDKIAEICGYDCYEVFMRQFKKYVGMSPSQYRNNVKRIKNTL